MTSVSTSLLSILPCRTWTCSSRGLAHPRRRRSGRSAARRPRPRRRRPRTRRARRARLGRSATRSSHATSRPRSWPPRRSRRSTSGTRRRLRHRRGLPVGGVVATDAGEASPRSSSASYRSRSHPAGEKSSLFLCCAESVELSYSMIDCAHIGRTMHLPRFADRPRGRRLTIPSRLSQHRTAQTSPARAESQRPRTP